MPPKKPAAPSPVSPPPAIILLYSSRPVVTHRPPSLEAALEKARVLFSLSGQQVYLTTQVGPSSRVCEVDSAYWDAPFLQDDFREYTVVTRPWTKTEASVQTNERADTPTEMEVKTRGISEQRSQTSLDNTSVQVQPAHSHATVSQRVAPVATQPVKPTSEPLKLVVQGISNRSQPLRVWTKHPLDTDRFYQALSQATGIAMTKFSLLHRGRRLARCSIVKFEEDLNAEIPIRFETSEPG